MATPANAFNGLLALRVIDTLQFYLALLSPVLIAGFEQRLSPEALHESIRIALAEWVDQAPGQDRGAAS
jgi:hypothetical protein